MSQPFPSPLVYHGDALEIIPGLGAFDYLMTDPPYPTGPGPGAYGSGMVQRIRAMERWMHLSFVMAAVRVLQKRDGFAAWIFCDWRHVSYLGDALANEGLGRQSCITWDKRQGSMSALYHGRTELCLFACSKEHRIKGYCGTNLVAVKRPGNRKTHPYEKPPALVGALMRPDPFPPGRIIDPFCGTGGLLVGARQLGHEAVGIDADEENVEHARRRIAESLL